MAKLGFYGAYGRDGGGVYTDWSIYDKSKQTIPSAKVKKFSSKKEAVSFIVNGLTNVYGVCEEDEIRMEQLCGHTNRYLREDELINYSMRGSSGKLKPAHAESKDSLRK